MIKCRRAELDRTLLALSGPVAGLETGMDSVRNVCRYGRYGR